MFKCFFYLTDTRYMRPNERNLRRRKRQTKSGRKYLEVLIVADTSVTAIVSKNKLETYLLTLMNIVSSTSYGYLSNKNTTYM